MANVEAIRERVLNKLAHVVDLGNGVVRGDREFNDRKFATAYVDLSDDIIRRSQNLSAFQEDLIGEDFFEGDGDQRWNSYLYFWAGPVSRAHADFLVAKSRIENDRHFARKFVLTEADLLSRTATISPRVDLRPPSATMSIPNGQSSFSWHLLVPFLSKSRGHS